jgi:hypothetical protein
MTDRFIGLFNYAATGPDFPSKVPFGDLESKKMAVDLSPNADAVPRI